MNLERLLTERRNPDTLDLDSWSTQEIVAAIHKEDEKVASAVRLALPQITEAVERIVAALQAGGRLFYIGAGTSGRLGVLDAAECPPTFNTPPTLVQALIAGGERAMFQAAEGAEDDLDLAGADLRAKQLTRWDVVVGLAASGRTPYVIGGLNYAAGLGCTTIGVVCVPEPALAKSAQVVISVPVGPEVITGSTRMKAGTAQKMVLNMLSTATMVRLGKTFGNLMVDVRATNAKLSARILRIVREATGAEEAEAAEVLLRAGGSAKIAIVMLLGNITEQEAEEILGQSHGSVRHALRMVENGGVTGAGRRINV